ncbi:MAG: (2Fe-2S)-binding protein [Betaproteobacteria bacterium]|nr:(2Fe-2S)-binding protein [Betaproteobacteria bacterium]MBI2961805.1 (2Fe-2S)-binding protein [Betaproteobacteria bacterium]
MGKERLVTIRVNGQPVEAQVEPRRSLLDFLREDAGLTGTHTGCEHGICGTCTVLVDGEAVRSCLMLAVQANGRDVFTVEGLARGEKLHPLQESFWKHHALQCGYCTPGMLIAAYDLLKRNPSPTEAQVRDALAGNICRCTGYVQIVEGVLEAAANLREKAETPHGEPSV